MQKGDAVPSENWVSLSDKDLLETRLCDLNLSIENSEIFPDIQKFQAELKEKGLEFEPHIYIGDEWFSPAGKNAISVPFYLCHPRLKSLEKSIMLDVEGENPDQCMKLLRHEAGHCFDHNFGFSRRAKWRKLFGNPSQDYSPETYMPRPYSRSFVQNLDNWYAQAHPDEDFAETFAVWLSTNRSWKQEYRKWPIALAKLEYIDALAISVVGRRGTRVKGNLPYDIRRSRLTLEKYYQRRRKESAEEYPDFFDADLKRIFSGEKKLPLSSSSASSFMFRNRREIIESVSFWTGAKKFTITNLVRKLSLRCESLDLRIGREESLLHLEIAAYLATLVTHYLFTGKFKRSV